MPAGGPQGSARSPLRRAVRGRLQGHRPATRPRPRKARGRYRTGSRAVRLALFLFVGVGIIIWSYVSPTEDAQLAAWLSHYTRFVTLPIVVLFAIPTWVDVGTDGVGWRWLFLHRYLPFSAIAAVEPVQRGSRVSAVRLTTKDDAKHIVWVTKESAALVRHVSDAFAAARTQAETADVDARLARKPGEPILGWLERLRAIGLDAGGYRGASTEQIWRVAEEASAPLHDRVAALVVLTSTEPARERARAIAARVVSPPARAMFEAIADATGEEQLARMLEPLLEEQKIAV